ncbi:hypothetical protein N658DRAFT_287550 [Parathielavia hyrcaniae]|uniref:Uncharacterized protein n=1 Tax=Parathielavia hyrcaniae TaxID=113614 RepID=A0AAN6SYH4_9PEZI|nr:hypothetical protein N658DRAFT_287550 [Parathielavia hyrcaniae]
MTWRHTCKGTERLGVFYLSLASRDLSCVPLTLYTLSYTVPNFTACLSYSIGHRLTDWTGGFRAVVKLDSLHPPREPGRGRDDNLSRKFRKSWKHSVSADTLSFLALHGSSTPAAVQEPRSGSCRSQPLHTLAGHTHTVAVVTPIFRRHTNVFLPEWLALDVSPTNAQPLPSYHCCAVDSGNRPYYRVQAQSRVDWRDWLQTP